jgi:hypothetical protein
MLEHSMRSDDALGCCSAATGDEVCALPEDPTALSRTDAVPISNISQEVT